MIVISDGDIIKNQLDQDYQPMELGYDKTTAVIGSTSYVTPEYNGSYTPSMKNLFDHFPKQFHKTFGIVTASTGVMGGMRASQQLQLLTLALFGIPSPYMLITPQVDKKFDPAGNLVDPSFSNSIHTFVSEFLWLAERLAA